VQHDGAVGRVVETRSDDLPVMASPSANGGMYDFTSFMRPRM
jgi:hypothetical protein